MAQSVRRLLLVSLAALLIPAAVPAAPRAPDRPPARPALIVLLMVDQMRADYLERYASLLPRGFNRLRLAGASYRNAAFPYLSTVTCAGHTTVGTGTFPYRHGMIMNGWFDRATGAVETCTDDPATREVSFGTLTGSGDSARRMRQPTLAEIMRRDRGARVVTMSLKARSAIGMAGHAGDAVIWFDDKGAFATSTAYAQAANPVLAAFTAAHPIDDARGRVWERTLPAERYLDADAAEGERPSLGWAAAFPHPLGTDDKTFYGRWQQSPLSDEYLEQMAEAAIDGLHLGRGPETDFLGLSFSALDLVGHAFGPRSHEVQDTLVRLDGTLERLLDYLDLKIGDGRYVVALSSDHGVADIPEQVGAGRVSSKQVVKAVDDALGLIAFRVPKRPVGSPFRPVTGSGTYVAAHVYTDLYFRAGVYNRLKKSRKGMAAVTAALQGIPGIARVLRGDQLASEQARTSTDPQIRAAALNYVPGRSGDLILIPAEHYLMTTTTTSHGTLYDYDQHVPIILYGASIQAGSYDQPVTPADIAVTLAAIAGVTLPSPDGHLLPAAAPYNGSGR